MRLIGLLLIILGVSGGIAIIRYYSPAAVEARRRQRVLDAARAVTERARLLAEENRRIDEILAGRELREERDQDNDPRYQQPPE